MRSVVVVFPASIWAMIPKLRYSSIGCERGILFDPSAARRLLAIMRESAVRFRHAVRVFAFLHRVAAIVTCIHELGREPVDHGLVVAAARGRDDPAYSERLAAIGTNFDRHLIGGAADAAGAHFDRGGDIVECRFENRERIGAQLAFDRVEGAVDDRLGDRLLALVHNGIHEFRENDVAIFGVRNNLTLFGAMAARHLALSYFGRLAPYFERRCLRSLTPCVSRTPRRM